jgi:protein Tex
VITDKERQVGAIEVGGVAKVLTALFENEQGRTAKVRNRRLDSARRDRHPRPRLDESGAAVPSGRERLLDEDGKTPLVGPNEAGLGPVDAQRTRGTRTTPENHVDHGVATHAVRDEERGAQAAEPDVQSAAGARDIVKEKVRRRGRVASNDDEAPHATCASTTLVSPALRTLPPCTAPNAMEEPTFDPSSRISDESRLPVSGVRAVIRLLANGATVPFVARYRKEQTGGLDEVQIRAIGERAAYLVDVDTRRRSILAEIESQGKLTPELREELGSCWVKAVLEDIYQPFKPKRRTRATIARERGLEPLATLILSQPAIGAVGLAAARFVDPSKGLADEKAVLAGARDIVAEMIANRPDVRGLVRDVFSREGVISSVAVKSKTDHPTKFESYYHHREKVRSIPSHRFLAIRRGEEEGVLRVSIEVDEEALAARISTLARRRPASPFAEELAAAISDAVARLLCPSIEAEVRAEAKLAADREAVAVFAENLRGLLLAPPLGRKVVIGVDPGQRTGCKCAVVDDTGKLVEHAVMHLVSGEGALARAREILASLLAKHRPFAIAVGNGTHGRETADFCREASASAGATVVVVMVSESGASVYSASETAREEHPDLDLTLRGAASIARRLQDPLAELVKIDPKSIGVGQYQHDIQPALLKRKLDDVVESCVNAVGVELNTASALLLAHVAGVGEALAKRIVAHRDRYGAFRARKGLLDVAGLGPKAFEQCAGFIRIRDAAHPLDASAVHPERYPLVGRIASDAKLDVKDLVGNADAVARIPWASYAGDEVGLPTLEDIRSELLKPGRDPRQAFEAPAFREDVRKLEDLAPGMELEGVVTNVTAFGAFVDVGVHQDGLVHVSQLANRFVRDPHEVAKVGDKIHVRVLEVDLARKRIALTAKTNAT